MVSPAYDVFLSYQSADRATVARLAERLRQAGIRPWFDVWDLSEGERFPRRLAEGIEASAAFVFFVGESAMDPHARWSDAEIDLALERARRHSDFRIIPVILPSAPDPDTTDVVPPFLRNRSRIDFRGGLDDPAAFGRLVEALRRPADPSTHRPGPDGGGRRTLSATRPPAEGGGSRMDGFTRSVAPISHLRSNPHLIQEPIARRTFTPLIGSGCSLVGRSQSEAWRRIARRVEHLIDVLGSDERAAMYVRGLASSSPYAVPLYGPAPDDLDDAVQNERLIDLQMALARLGTHLGRLFAAAMVDSATPVWDAVAYRLQIRPDDPSLLEACRWSVLACVAAHELKSTREGRDPTVGLGASGMYDRLVELTAHFDHDSHLTRDSLRNSDQRLNNVYDDVFSDIGRARRREHDEELLGLATGGYLSLHELEWVADALWHTFRYDQAAYPRADEFAFQVALFVIGATGRRPERDVALEAARPRLTSETIATWFHRYSGSPSNRMLAFYDALAKVLVAGHEGSRPTGAGGREGIGSINPLHPVAFSMNYDLEMERALQQCEESTVFHVVVPIYAYLDPESEPEVQWLIGRTTKHTSVERPQWTWFPQAGLPRRGSIQGPILIKLNGSPLHDLPSPGEVGGIDQYSQEFQRFEHALILSETEHLQHIVWRDMLPDFGETVLLRKERTLVFLGHSIKEWSTRLRMFSQIHRPTKPRVKRAESQMLAINRTHDPFRSAILGSIGVHRLVGDLEEFTRLVEGLLE